jgi:hypothetical protein
MKAIFLGMFLSVLMQNTVNAQNRADSVNSKTTLRDTIYNVQNVIGFIPSKAEKINGWAVGWLMLGAKEHLHDSVIINGIYTNPSPIAVILGVMALPYLVVSPFLKETYSDSLPVYTDSIIENKINGVGLSVIELSDRYTVNGAQFALIALNMFKVNGFSANLGFSEYQYMNGVVIAGVLNQTYKGKGVQIGFINVAQDFRGVQIGLWNKNGKRGFPIINMKFKKNN